MIDRLLLDLDSFLAAQFKSTRLSARAAVAGCEPKTRELVIGDTYPVRTNSGGGLSGNDMINQEGPNWKVLPSLAHLFVTGFFSAARFTIIIKSFLTLFLNSGSLLNLIKSCHSSSAPA